ncbi:secondary thiamine-phosphate synthase enzyme YjbQ [Halomicroarcula sp. GCM10025324]|jgi:secondary thiamine-phosphate synthase enzyme|uniref:secondary thiamine-phosphate synthase enzyme YjbQ n=1 Tax=Haloarcula TaxID=2237 RepID=UPI0023E8A043|nr:secondary thiamine-phosphate synthase enzyme YjbQ [Halomicroarcula sp. ZS-22-S1]
MGSERILVSTDRRLSVVDITEKVQNAVPPDLQGTCTVFARHTTTGITVNEAESRLLDDFETALSDIVADEGWEHDSLDGNADSHVRAMLVGPSETIPVMDGDLDLGTWQSVLLVDCDGPRERAIDVCW